MTRTYYNQFTITEERPLTIPEFILKDTQYGPWEDISWGNCTCPQFCNAMLGLAIWVDYDNYQDREFDDPEGTKYAVVTYDASDEDSEAFGEIDIFRTNSAEELQNFCREYYLKAQLTKVTEELNLLLSMVINAKELTPLAERMLPYIESACDDLTTAGQL